MKRSFPSWDEIPRLREFRSLQEMGPHKNIVQLQEVIREHNQYLYFVFEYMPDGNLYEFVKRHTHRVSMSQAQLAITPVLTECKIRSITSQILEGLGFLHSRGYIHRDIKPENILMHGDTCKLADFGLARESSCQAPITDYVSTRWYRAPEVLLRSPDYGKPIDLFGLGCIVAELYNKIPLFPGDNEIQQVSLITQVLGTPENCWQEGIHLASKLGMNLKPDKPPSLADKVPSASPEAIDLMTQMLHWNPNERPTCREALSHAYFATATMTTPPVARTKRPMVISASPPQQKRRRTEDNSPRSIHDLYEGAWAIPNLPFFYR